MSVAGFMVIRNGTRLGYPWVESILCVLPWVDKFYISEGYSDDDTLLVCQKLALKYRHRVFITRDEWPTGLPSGFAIGSVTNAIVSRLHYQPYDWLFMVQADELWPEESCRAVAEFVASPLAAKIDALEFPFLHLACNFQERQFEIGKESYTHAIRVVRNTPSIRAHRDAWTFEGYKYAGRLDLAKPIVHANSIHWKNWPLKARSHADTLYTDLPYYRVSAEEREAIVQAGELDQSTIDPKWYARTSPFDESLPEIVKPLIGMAEYEVRDELVE